MDRVEKRPSILKKTKKWVSLLTALSAIMLGAREAYAQKRGEHLPKPPVSASSQETQASEPETATDEQISTTLKTLESLAREQSDSGISPEQQSEIVRLLDELSLDFLARDETWLTKNGIIYGSNQTGGITGDLLFHGSLVELNGPPYTLTATALDEENPKNQISKSIERTSSDLKKSKKNIDDENNPVYLFSYGTKRKISVSKDLRDIILEELRKFDPSLKPVIPDEIDTAGTLLIGYQPEPTDLHKRSLTFLREARFSISGTSVALRLQIKQDEKDSNPALTVGYGIAGKKLDAYPPTVRIGTVGNGNKIYGEADAALVRNAVDSAVSPKE